MSRARRQPSFYEALRKTPRRCFILRARKAEKGGRAGNLLLSLLTMPAHRPERNLPPYPSDAAWRRMVAAVPREANNDLPGATIGLFPGEWAPQVFWNPDPSLPPVAHPLPLGAEQLDWLGDLDLPAGAAKLNPGRVAWRLPCREAVVQVLLHTPEGQEGLALGWLDGQGLLAGLERGAAWTGENPYWDGAETNEDQQAHFLVARQGSIMTSWALAARSWDAWISLLGQEMAASQQQAEGRRCRLVLRLADALSDHPDPDRFLDRLWTAAGEYGLVSIQWWSPRFEARRLIDYRGPRWERPARPNAMEIDCAQAGSSLQYADRQAEVVPGRARWRLCVPVNEGQKIAGGGVISFTADRRFSLEESDAFEQCASFLERALRGVDERIAQAQHTSQRESELNHSLDALVQEMARTKKNELLQTSLFRIARLASDQAHADDFHAKVHAILGGLVRVDTLAVLLDSPNDSDTPLSLVYLEEGDGSGRSDQGTPSDETERQYARLAAALASQATQRRAPVLARDPRRGAAAGSWMAAPLLDEGRAIGALCLRASEGHTHDADDLDALALCAQQVAHAINRQRAVALLEARVAERTAELRVQQAHAQRQALHDPLTDLPNRRHLEERLGKALESSRTGTPLVLMFLDLDRFKDVNDGYGHAAGDTVLVEVARRLANSLRPSDFVARLSGDEFVVLLQPAGDQNKSQQVAERLIHAVSQDIRLESGSLTNVGCSIGWTTVKRAEGLEAGVLLSRADQAMYSAKRNGRGRAVSFDWAGGNEEVPEERRKARGGAAGH